MTEEDLAILETAKAKANILQPGRWFADFYTHGKFVIVKVHRGPNGEETFFYYFDSISSKAGPNDVTKMVTINPDLTLVYGTFTFTYQFTSGIAPQEP